jgi:hypothetical protein
MKINQGARVRRAEQAGELPRLEHGVPQRGSYRIGPHRAELSMTELYGGILPQASGLCQQKQKKREALEL